MKLVILVVFSLILLVYSEDVQKEVQVAPDQHVASSLYETIFSSYFNEKPESFNRRPAKKSSKTKSSRSKTQLQQIQIKSSQPKKTDEIKEIVGYVEKPTQENKAEYDKLVGRKGLGFEKRTATSYGMRSPITSESLTVIGRNNEKKMEENNKGFTIYV